MLGTIILAGGKGNRIGGNKPLIKLGGKELILHVVEVAEKISDELVVVLNRIDDIGLYDSIFPDKVEITTDIGEKEGPLIGACSGLRKIQSEYALILPCDTPFISVHVLRHLVNSTSSYDASVPYWPNGYTEPLHSVYRVEAATEACKKTLIEGKFRITEMISRLKTRYVPIDEVKKLDPELLTFFNINNHQDLKKAKLILKKRKVRSI